MIYRTNQKPRKVVKIDVSKVPSEHLEWFLKGVQAAMNAIKKTDG